jgi:hypothetical protein
MNTIIIPARASWQAKSSRAPENSVWDAPNRMPAPFDQRSARTNSSRLPDKSRKCPSRKSTLGIGFLFSKSASPTPRRRMRLMAES